MVSTDSPLDGDPADQHPDPTPARRTGHGGGGTVLAAAMLAVGEILEPQNLDVEIQEEAPSDLLDLPGGLELDFGDLPDLD